MFDFLKRKPESLLRTMEKKFTKYYGFNPNDLVKQNGVIYKFTCYPDVSDMLENSYSICDCSAPASKKDEEAYYV